MPHKNALPYRFAANRRRPRRINQQCQERHHNVGDGVHRRQIDQQGLDLMRSGARRDRLGEVLGDAADEVADRAEGPRDRKVVTRSGQDPPARAEIAQEPRDERRLADAGLARDENDAPRAPRCLGMGADERRERPVPFEELHTSTIDPLQP